MNRDGWYATGRVPNTAGTWRKKELGPYATAKEAGEAGRQQRLGGLKLYEVRDGRLAV